MRNATGECGLVASFLFILAAESSSRPSDTGGGSTTGRDAHQGCPYCLHRGAPPCPLPADPTDGHLGTSCGTRLVPAADGRHGMMVSSRVGFRSGRFFGRRWFRRLRRNRPGEIVTGERELLHPARPSTCVNLAEAGESGNSNLGNQPSGR